MRKVFVDVLVQYTKEGEKIPVSITWENGHKYEIDRIKEVKRAASLKVGGQGIRYNCRIQEKETFLWLEEDKWFVEAK